MYLKYYGTVGEKLRKEGIKPQYHTLLHEAFYLFQFCREKKGENEVNHFAQDFLASK